MRALVTRDIFTMSRIITKMDIKDELRRLATNKEGASTLNLGIDMMLAILTKVSDRQIENEIYGFLASVLECQKVDIEESDPFVLIDRLTKDDGAEQWKDFFSKLYRLMSGRLSSHSGATEEA